IHLVERKKEMRAARRYQTRLSAKRSRGLEEE
ncbi:hypothetical protein CCACVL1_02140, partial [Corchorus capsularis]